MRWRSIWENAWYFTVFCFFCWLICRFKLISLAWTIWIWYYWYKVIVLHPPLLKNSKIKTCTHKVRNLPKASKNKQTNKKTTSVTISFIFGLYLWIDVTILWWCTKRAESSVFALQMMSPSFSCFSLFAHCLTNSLHPIQSVMRCNQKDLLTLRFSFFLSPWSVYLRGNLP